MSKKLSSKKKLTNLEDDIDKPSSKKSIGCRHFLVDHYFSLYESYSKEYPKPAILYKKGGFYELFSHALIPSKSNVELIAKDLGLNYSTQPGNILQYGFPEASLSVYIKKLTDLAYTVIIYKEIPNESDPKKKTRVLDKIVSIGTRVDDDEDIAINDVDTATVGCLFIKADDDSSFNEVLDCGLTVVNLSTGKINNYSIINKFNEAISLSNKIISASFVSELVLITEDNTKNKILSDLKLLFEKSVTTLHLRQSSKTIKNRLYQEELLRKVFFENELQTFNSSNISIINKQKDNNSDGGSDNASNNDFGTDLEDNNEEESNNTKGNPNHFHKDILSDLGLTYYNILTLSLVVLLEFINSHDPFLLSKLSRPIITEYTGWLNINSHIIFQLNLVSNEKYNKKLTLFSVINKTSTKMGQRLLRERLLYPIINVDEINERYSQIEKILESGCINQSEGIMSNIKNICDLDRFVRKINTKIFSPHDFCILIPSLRNVINVFNFVKRLKIQSIKLSSSDIDLFKDALHNLESNINVKIAEKYNTLNRNSHYSIFNIGVYPEIDTTVCKLEELWFNMKAIQKTINQYLDEKDGSKLEKTPSEGYFFKMTKKRFDVLQKTEELEGIESKKVSSKSQYVKVTTKTSKKLSSNIIACELKLAKLIKNSLNDFLEKFSNKYTKVIKSAASYIAKIDVAMSSAIVSQMYSYCKPEIVPIPINHEFFEKKVEEPSKNLKESSLETTNAISLFVNQEEIKNNEENNLISDSIYEEAEFNDYYEEEIEKKKDADNRCRQKDKSDERTHNISPKGNDRVYSPSREDKYIENSYYKSYFDATELRHPILERLDSKEPFVSNNLCLGKDYCGIILYSINGSGKSILIQSFIECIILAQMGMYVPAKTFTYYPYKHIIAKISTHDNFYQGKSLFEMELDDLKDGLNVASPNSLILADEPFIGTETDSAVSLAGALIYYLAKRNVNLFFATHLHQIRNISLVSELKNIQYYYLSVHNTKSKLIYDRKLIKGVGSNDYGIEVAKHIVKNSEFINLSLFIRKEIHSKTNPSKSLTVSKYNKNLIIDKCQKCGSTTNLHTHHKQEQHLANTSGIINGTHKNRLSNLEVLCEECHIKHHHQEEEISLEKNKGSQHGLPERENKKNLTQKEKKKSIKSPLKYDKKKIKKVNSSKQIKTPI